MIEALAIVTGLTLTFLVVVVVHELGHFWAARCVGVVPETFSIGFGATLWSRRSRSGALWRIALVPLGGYVRFVGDENAASMSMVPKGPALPGSLRSASRLRQSLVVVSGPAANVLLAIALMSCVPLLSGVTAYPWVVDRMGTDLAWGGLRRGDTVLQVGSITIRPDSLPGDVLAAQADRSVIPYRVRRDGTELTVMGPRQDLPLIGLVAPGSPADRAGLETGDLVVLFDGEPLSNWSDLRERVARSAGRSMDAEVRRGHRIVRTSLNPKMQGGQWIIGVGSAPLFTLAKVRPSAIEALSQGIMQSLTILERTASGLARSVFGQGDVCALDGPLAIGRVAGQAIQLGAESFLTFIAVISLGLGLLNLLPIPTLDGGHLLLLGLEGATGRPVGKRVQAVLFISGVTMIVFLMLSATIGDLTC